MICDDRQMYLDFNTERNGTDSVWKYLGAPFVGISVRVFMFNEKKRRTRVGS